MKRNSIQLSIPEPCDQSWQSMTPDTNGRFCQHCQKTVIDFSMMSDQEIASIINRSKGELCGRLLTSQLGREIGESKRHTPFRKVAAVISALALSIPAVSAMAPKAATTLSPAKKDTTVDTTITMIEGHVIDSIDQLSLPGVTIRIKGTSTGTITDADGKFMLRIPPHMIENNISLVISFVGFINKEIIVTDEKAALVIALARRPEEELVPVVAGGIWYVPTKLTFLQRTKQKVRNLFH